MKKLILPLVAILLCMAGCQKENGILYLETETYTGDAKLHLDSEHYAVWDNNDNVLVNGTEYTVAVGSKNATITGVPEAESYTAIYPADWANTTGTSINYPAKLTYSATSIEAPMAAYSDGDSKLNFHNLGSILAVEVSGVESVKAIKVVAEGTTAINGNCIINNLTEGTPSLSAPTDGTNTVTLNCNGISIPATGKTFYIALPPVTAKLTVIIEDGFYRYTKSQNTARSYTANHGYNVPFDASTATEEQYAPLSNQIWYKTSDNNPIDAFGFNSLSSNTYNSTLGYCVATYNSNITTIPVSGLNGNGTMTDIILPEGLTSIQQQAFIWCGSLSNVVLPYSLTYIGPEVFWGCSLNTIEIPNPNAKLDNNVFYQSGVQTVILHSNNVFTDETISNWSYLGGFLQMYYEMWVAFMTEEEAINRAWEQFNNSEKLWYLNQDDDAPFITVYVPDVTACRDLSYDGGYVSFLGSNYIYKPWQYLVDNNKIKLLPLSSL